MNSVCSFSKIGEILLNQNEITYAQLNEALKQQHNRKLGEILIKNNYITEYFYPK